MGRRKKETVELRFYEIPQGEPVLALLGEEWNRVYGHDSPYMHFHNLMEIGVCRNGEGVVVLDEKDYFYQNGTITIIPQNISHNAKSKVKNYHTLVKAKKKLEKLEKKNGE